MKAKAVLSAMIGILFAAVTYAVLCYCEIPDAFWAAVAAGSSVYLALFAFLTIYERVTNKRYASFEKNLTSPVFYKTNGNFDLGNGKLKNGNIYFCEAGIVCVCLEEKPYTLDEILLSDITGYRFGERQLHIVTTDGRLFVLTLADVQQVMAVLKEKGWIDR